MGRAWGTTADAALNEAMLTSRALSPAGQALHSENSRITARR